MTAGPTFTPPPYREHALRVSDTERERAVEMLQAAYAEGRIDHAELDRRIEGALAAKDRADLAQALRGLPLPERTSGPVRDLVTPGAQPTGEERAIAMLAHWLGFVTLFVGPALIALTKGKTSAYVRQHAWEATNFQLTFIGVNIAAGILTGVTFGLAGLLFVPILFLWFILMGVGGLAAAAGNRFRYPWNVRLLG